jgi:hypothetical protein
MGLTPEVRDSPASAGPRRPLLVWCLLRDQRSHVEPVERHFGGGAEFVYDSTWEPDAMLRRRPDLVLCVNDYHYDVARCLDVARAAGIPSLVLQDGILEWRCQYENPLFGAGGGAPQHQPVLADKIACLGASSARHIASWGNPSKVEVTGMPRLDALAELRLPPPKRPGRRLLVMTAKKPWYDEAQRTVIERSLAELKQYLSTRPDIEVVWRVTRGLSEELRVENRLKALDTLELSGVLAEVDAVITTPSTAILEAMLASRPVAALDYFNVPRFVQSAWTITSADHLPKVVSELMAPPATRMLFQSECQRDSLRTDGSAAGRVGDLVTAMARIGQDCRTRRLPLHLSPCLVDSSASPHGSPLPALTDLYPEHSTLQEQDAATLRLRLVRLEKEYARLRGGSLVARIGRTVRRIVGA